MNARWGRQGLWPANPVVSVAPRGLGSGVAIAALIVASGCGSATYSISGTVLGAAPAAVTVKLSGAALGADRTTGTDPNGNYVFSGVPEGVYTVEPALPGFSMSPTSAVATVDHASVNGVNFACRAVLEVWGRDMGAQDQFVSVQQAGIPLSDATVTVNGMPLTYTVSSNQDGYYSGALPSVLSTGQRITLEVMRGASTVTAIGSIPEMPLVTAPQDGAIFGVSDNIPVSWTSTTDPDRFTVIAEWSCGTGCGTGISFDVPGAARTFTIPASSIPSGQTIVLQLYAYNDGMFSGDYEPRAHPGMNIRAFPVNEVTIQR
jgi:hypothetical protein